MKADDDLLKGYMSTLARAFASVVATNSTGEVVPLDTAITWAFKSLDGMRADGGKAIFVGNGGSAAIASHMAIDYCKNGGIPALAFNDAAALTCLTNDIGYESVFSHQISALGKREDMLFAISSSGASANIIAAAKSAASREIKILTLSGFDDDNPLRKLGHMNFFVPMAEYGFVEITHLALCHAILDFSMEWRPETSG